MALNSLPTRLLTRLRDLHRGGDRKMVEPEVVGNTKEMHTTGQLHKIGASSSQTKTPAWRCGNAEVGMKSH